MITKLQGVACAPALGEGLTKRVWIEVFYILFVY